MFSLSSLLMSSLETAR